MHSETKTGRGVVRVAASEGPRAEATAQTPTKLGKTLTANDHHEEEPLRWGDGSVLPPIQGRVGLAGSGTSKRERLIYR